MSEESTGNGSHEAYWNELVLIKIVSCYIRRYRDSQNYWINSIGIFKAVVTSTTIAAWAIWKELALVWGILIAISQVLDAVKEFLPQAKHRREASQFVSALEDILVDARHEWHGIFSGDYKPNDIMARWKKLAKRLNEAERKYFPDGLPLNEKRQRLAEDEAMHYFSHIYNVEGASNG